MSDFDHPDGDGISRRPSLADVVAVADRGDGFAYVPGQVLARAVARDRVEQLTGQTPEPVSDREAERGDRGWLGVRDVDDPIATIDVLRAEGFDAQPNHVMFVHGCGNPCPPHPALVQEIIEYGLLADPMRANPMRANPMRANPMRANPMRANPMRANDPMESTALPTVGRRWPERALQGPGPYPTVVVLDTGLAGKVGTGAAMVDHSAPLLRPAMAAAAGGPRVTGSLERPDDAIDLGPLGTASPDGYLDPAAGHGTFIAGIVEQLAPGCRIDVRRVIDPLGAARETAVAAAVHHIVDQVENGDLDAPVIVNMSFGGQVMDAAGYLREAVTRAIAAGIAIVASAGNDALCTPQYPAAFPGVVGVAALGPDGPAPFTNYGDWVDACAPGVDIVSSFFAKFDGKRPNVNTLDPDKFDGWAEWSGTSFATPVVVAAIARELVCGFTRDPLTAKAQALTARQAVDRVVHAPHLARLACLGTIVTA